MVFTYADASLVVEFSKLAAEEDRGKTVKHLGK